MALQGGLPKVSLESAGEWLKKSDPKLDQIKEAVSKDLESLKKGQDISAALKETMLKGFKVDLDELGISGKAQDEYVALFENSWKEMETGAQAREILESPELAAMDSFITTLENLPILKEMMESAQPKTKLESWFMGMASAKIPALGKHWETIKTTFLSWIEWDKIKQDPDWAPWLAMIGVETGAVATAAATATAAKANPAQKEAEKKAPEKVAEKEEEGKGEGGKGGEEKATSEATAESEEETEVAKKPGPTLIVGDSINDIFRYDKEICAKLGIKDDAIKTLTKGSETTDWLLTALRKKPTSFFEGLANVIITIGTNDLGDANRSVEKIWKNMEAIHDVFAEKGIIIHVATLPPGKGNKAGLWGSDFEKLEKRRLAINDRIRGSNLQVIDLAATREQGGLADNKNPDTLAEELRRDGPKDFVHPKGDTLAEIYKKALTGKA